MSRDTAQHAQHVLESVLRSDRARILARVVRIVGDLQFAEDALQDACIDAAREWVNAGVPVNPQGWLVTVARRRAIDRFRSLSAASRREKALFDRTVAWEVEPEDGPVPDDRLRLIFTCCHPALAPEIQVALTLHVVGSLTTAEIASAFMVTDTTMAQRITRGKRKIRDAHIAYRIPGPEDLPKRLESVLATIYLIFTTGYLAPTGVSPVRIDLLDEALRLVDVLVELLPHDAEVLGLGALMHLTDARRATRLDVGGLPIDLAHQDRTLWDSDEITRGLTLLSRARAANAPGPYQIQAAEAAGRDPDALTFCVAAPAYVGDDIEHQRDQCRWFGGMVGNHVADIVERYGDDPEAHIPTALTDYIKGRQGYDYNEHGRAGNTHADFVPDAVIDRFCLLGPASAHIERLEELREIGVDQFAVYLQHDAKVPTLEAYGETIIPALSGPPIAKR